MSRPCRQFTEGLPVHLVQRGNNRSACFFDDADRTVYLGMLAELARLLDVRLHAYVLMTNHIHLLATPAHREAPSKLMQRLGVRYAAYVNRRYQRSGSLWEGRFRASMVETDAHVLACHRYIELNPVRAGMVIAPEQYRWSSHAANVGITDSGMLSVHSTVAALGADRTKAAAAYRALFTEALDENVVAALREGIRTAARRSSTGVRI